jgi:hypothetical protein
MMLVDVDFRIFLKWLHRALEKDFGKPQPPKLVRSRALEICLEVKSPCNTLAQVEPVEVVGRMHGGSSHVQHGDTES